MITRMNSSKTHEKKMNKRIYPIKVFHFISHKRPYGSIVLERRMIISLGQVLCYRITRPSKCEMLPIGLLQLCDIKIVVQETRMKKSISSEALSEKITFPPKPDGQKYEHTEGH